jgi:hypothetical protein
MEAVIGGFMVATLFAITFIAYRQPGDFQKIGVAIVISSGIIIMLVASYILGVTILREAVEWDDKFPAEIQVLIGNTAHHPQPPYWMWPAAIAAQLYVVFLCFMCRFTRNRQRLCASRN